MPRAEQRIRDSGVQACQRCRRRKQKCDQRFPQCSNCERVNVPCLTYHSGKQADIPRDYVSILEEKIAKLTQEVHDLRSRHIPATHDTGGSIATESQSETGSVLRSGQASLDGSLPLVQLVTSVKNVGDPHQPQRFLGQGSGLSFARMVMAAIHLDELPSTHGLEHRQQRAFSEYSFGSPDKASLPPRHVADHLVHVYFQYRTPHLPILERSQVAKAIENAYASLHKSQGSDGVPQLDMFVAYMVFAIALVDVPHTSGGRPSQSDGCFRSALGWVENILTYSKGDLETLRVVLLLAQFVALSPTRGSLWHLTGFALRLCIDAGLHWETDVQCLNMDPMLLDDRRRLWHSTYHFDRLMCITLGRPFGIVDESIRVQLPNPWTASRQHLSHQPSEFDIHTQRAHNHLFALARLESEIKHVHHSETWAVKLAYPRPNWPAWLKEIQPRLQEWHATIPELSKAHPASIFASDAYWSVIYHNAILLLYRPNSVSFRQSAEETLICFEASTKVVVGLKTLQWEGRVEMLWKSVHQLFLAGLGVIYGLWHSKEIRDQTPVSECISTLQSCASTLSAMSETFQGATGCRNTFDALSSATIDWLVTRDIEETRQNRTRFESQVKNMMSQLQLSREDQPSAYHGTDNMSAMLSVENYDLSELLNNAAQWPDLGDFYFDMEQQVEMAGALNMNASGEV